MFFLSRLYWSLQNWQISPFWRFLLLCVITQLGVDDGEFFFLLHTLNVLGLLEPDHDLIINHIILSLHWDYSLAFCSFLVLSLILQGFLSVCGWSAMKISASNQEAHISCPIFFCFQNFNINSNLVVVILRITFIILFLYL